MANYLGLTFVGTSSQYLTSMSAITPPANTSVSFWCILTEADVPAYIFFLSNDWFIGVETNGGSPPRGIVNGLQQGADLSSSTGLQIDSLYHIVCTATASARQIFINGVLDNSAASGGTPPGGGSLYIGTGNILSNFFTGKLEDIRIYNRVLSLAEVQTIHALRGVDNITYGLLHRWPLNELPIGSSFIPDTNFGITTSGGSNYAVNWTRFMGGDFPNIDGLKLISVSIYVGTLHSNQVRVAVYQGGTTTLPTGATLVEDLGLTTGSGTNQWLTLVSSSKPTLTADEPIWVAVKGGGSNFRLLAAATATGNWYSSHGRTDVGAMGTDQNTAYPSTVPSGGVNADFWYSFYLTYGDESGTGQIKDFVQGQINLTPYGNPLYSGSQLKYKRNQ